MKRSKARAASVRTTIAEETGSALNEPEDQQYLAANVHGGVGGFSQSGEPGSSSWTAQAPIQATTWPEAFPGNPGHEPPPPSHLATTHTGALSHATSVKSGRKGSSRHGGHHSASSSVSYDGNGKMKMPEPVTFPIPNASRPGSVTYVRESPIAGPSTGIPPITTAPPSTASRHAPPPGPTAAALARSLAQTFGAGAASARPHIPTNTLPTLAEIAGIGGAGTPRSDPTLHHDRTPHTHFGGVTGLMSQTITFARSGNGTNAHVIVRRKPKLIESEGAALVTAEKAFFGNHRPTRERIYWSLPMDHDERVRGLIEWVGRMSWALSELALDRFLSTRMRGALMTNADFRPWASPNEPAFDWMPFSEAQRTKDQQLQEYITTYDPMTTSLVFIFLVSESGNSAAIWRRKLTIPPSLQLRHADDVARIKAEMRKQPHLIQIGPEPRTSGRTEIYTAPATRPRRGRSGYSSNGTPPPVPPKKKRWWKRMFRFRKKKPDGEYHRDGHRR